MRTRSAQPIEAAQESESLQLSPFGQQLRSWRTLCSLSQSELALLSGTTPRYVSFIETGRSRPGRELILRLASSMNLPARARNDLLVAAGFAAEFPLRSLDDKGMTRFASVVHTLLERHEPYPACALDALGQIYFCNRAFQRLFPGAETRTPEEHVDALFGSPDVRQFLDNWSEVAWAWFDRQRHVAITTQNKRLHQLVERAANYLRAVPRPEFGSQSSDEPAVCARMRIGGRVISTFAATMQFEGAREVTASELRIELVFPVDAESAHFFEQLALAENESHAPSQTGK